MAARGDAADDARPRSAYATLPPRLSQRGLLAVFYGPVLDLARLVQATDVPRDLDPVEIARGEDRWRWSVSPPMQVLKLWADLQAVRKEVQAAHASADAASRPADPASRPADPDLVRGCMHLYHTMDDAVLHVSPQLASWFVGRLLVGEERLEDSRVLSARRDVADGIERLWQGGEFQRSLALYLKTQIRHGLQDPDNKTLS